MNEQIILNPISDLIKNCVNETIEKFKIAVPFISSFAKKMWIKSYIDKGKNILENINVIEKAQFTTPCIVHCGCIPNRNSLQFTIFRLWCKIKADFP